MPVFTVDRRKGSTGFEWAVLRDGIAMVQLATYLQAFRIVQIANENQLTPERMAELESKTRGESFRRSHAEIAVRARRYS